MQFDKLSAEERRELAAQISVKIAAWQAEDAKLGATGDRLAVDIEAGIRRHEAYELTKRLGELRGVSFNLDTANKWQLNFQQILEQEKQDDQRRT
jgi:hypothetical protein